MLGGGRDGDDKFVLKEKRERIAAKTHNYRAVRGADNYRCCGGLHVATRHPSPGAESSESEPGDYVSSLPRRID